MKYIVGFLSAWLLFQVQEIWKSWKRAADLRIALLAELEGVESALSLMVSRRGPQLVDIRQAVDEAKWIRANQQRFPGHEDLPDFPKEAPETDEQLADLLRQRFPGAYTTHEISLPVLKGSLSALGGFGLSVDEMIALVQFNWQLQLLNTFHQQISDFTAMTFTVLDETNHPIIVQNIQDAQMGYSRRLVHALAALRRATRHLRAPTLRAYLRSYAPWQ